MFVKTPFPFTVTEHAEHVSTTDENMDTTGFWVCEHGILKPNGKSKT